MPAISTGTAAFSYNAQVSTGVLSISTTSTADMIESQSITSQRKTYVVGQATTTASVEAYYDQGDLAIAAVESDSVNPTSRAVVITYATGMTISGNAYVMNFAPSIQMNDVCRCTFELQFTGTVTIA